MDSLQCEIGIGGSDFQALNASEVGEAALLVAAEPMVRRHLEAALRGQFSHVRTASNVGEACTLAQQYNFDFLVASLQGLGPINEPELGRELQYLGNGRMSVIFITDFADCDAAIAALQGNTADLIRKPFQIEPLTALIGRARERKARRENYLLHGEAGQRPAVERMIGDSPSIKEVQRIIHRVAPRSCTVLIKGETGTGKELAARALHDLSGRRGRYAAVNCAAIPEELFEGELFGHYKGAFTDTHLSRRGLFSHADGGTLFLDEIAEMPLSVQAKLLRVLEAKSYRLVGGNGEIPVNTRVLAATSRDLAAEVLAGRFRKDLYYRINVIGLHLPPLRERKGDIACLARLFLNTLSVELGIATPELEPWDLEQLLHYDWPGNIRELRNVTERSLLLGRPLSHFIDVSDLHDPVPKAAAPNAASLEDVERSHILGVVRAASGNKAAAARTLGISRKTVERKLREWGTSEV